MIDDRKDKIKEFMDSSEMRKVSRKTSFLFIKATCSCQCLPVKRLSFKQVKVEKEIEDSEKLFNELMGNVQQIQSKVKSNIDENLRKCREQDQVMIQKLEEEITSLQRKHSQLEELSQNDDHLQLLQVSGPNQTSVTSKTWTVRVSSTYDSFQTLQALNTTSGTQDWSRISAYSDMCMQTVRRAVSHLVTTFQMKLKMLTDKGKESALSVLFISLYVFCNNLVPVFSPLIELTRMRQYKG